MAFKGGPVLPTVQPASLSQLSGRATHLGRQLKGEVAVELRKRANQVQARQRVAHAAPHLRCGQKFRFWLGLGI